LSLKQWKKMSKIEKFGYLTVSLFSILMIFAGITGIAGYFSLDYISGAVSELLPDVQIYSSSLFLVQFLLILISAVFLHWVSITGFSGKKSRLLQTGAFLLTLCSTAVNLLMIYKNDFGWIGSEIFHGQAIASNRLFTYLGILVFLMIILSASISGSILFQKSEAKQHEKRDELD